MPKRVSLLGGAGRSSLGLAAAESVGAAGRIADGALEVEDHQVRTTQGHSIAVLLWPQPSQQCRP